MKKFIFTYVLMAFCSGILAVAPYWYVRKQMRSGFTIDILALAVLIAIPIIGLFASYVAIAIQMPSQSNSNGSTAEEIPKEWNAP